MRRWRWVLFTLYCMFIIYYTIVSRPSTAVHRIEWRLLWSYREMFAGDPNWKKDVVQNLQIILFFIPLGFLLPLKRGWIVLIVAELFSTLIEIVQYFGGYGLAELDDVICNTLGAVIGFGVWKLIKGKLDAVGEKT